MATSIISTVDPDYVSPNELVVQGWNSAQAYADTAYSNANAYLVQLSSLADTVANIPIIDAETGPIDRVIDAFLSPVVPTMGLLPAAPTPAAAAFEWGEEAYQSTLLTSLRDVLLSMTGQVASGLPTAVETRLWDRVRRRESVSSRKGIENAMNQAAARGFRRPPGSMFIEIQRAIQDELTNVSTASMEIAVKVADLEQTNRQFVLGKAWDMEKGMMDYIAGKESRALDASKFLSGLVVEVYKSHVEAYVSQVRSITDVFKTQGEVFKSVVDGQAAKIRAQTDVYQTDANVQQVQVKARIDAAQANVQALIEKVRLIGEAIKSGAQVSAQLAASALSAVNLSGGISSSDSRSTSYSSSDSSSTSESKVDSTSTSKSESVVDSTSNSTSESQNHNYNHSE
jgi:hypothetical protein